MCLEGFKTYCNIMTGRKKGNRVGDTLLFPHSGNNGNLLCDATVPATLNDLCTLLTAYSLQYTVVSMSTNM